MYKTLIRPLLFRFDAEKIHNLALAAGEKLGQFALTRRMVGALYDYHGPDISRVVDGLPYRTPFVLAAGFDYNGRLTQILPALGLGGVEIGSVTSRPGHGNPPPRLRRLVRSRAIVVNKGLKNDGVKIITARLRQLPPCKNFVLGVSIARTNDRQAAETKGGIKDYCDTLRHCLENNTGDYYTLNISCPNAYGGETFAQPELLKQLLAAVTALDCPKPLYVKLPINLDWEKLNELLQIIVEHNLNGVIIGNLNKNYSDLNVPEERPEKFMGGLSGAPCRALSTQLIKKTRATYGRKLTIIGCGGVMSPADVKEKLAAGADLIQLITGLIFEGPGLVKRLCRAHVQSPVSDYISPPARRVPARRLPPRVRAARKARDLATDLGALTG